MSDEFINSQVEYYRKHIRCGPSRDWNMIAGLYHYYKGLQNARRKSLTN
jgi:hypothetical protein